MQQTFVEVVKSYYQFAGACAALFGIAWGVRIAHEGVRNHLTHIEASTKQAAEEIAVLREAAAVTKSQHDTQIMLLTSIELNGRT